MRKILLSLVLLIMSSAFASAQLDTLIKQNFDSFNNEDKVAQVCGDPWTTWSNAPGGAEDGAITNTESVSPSNSALVSTNNDLVVKLSKKTEGMYQIAFKIRVAAGNIGYFNVLQKFAGQQSEWGMQVYFQDGICKVDAGGSGANSMPYTSDTWIPVTVFVDLDADQGVLVIDNKCMAIWQWSKGAQGDGTLNELDAVNFFGWDGSKATAKYYIDDFLFAKINTTTEAPTAFTAVLNSAGTGASLNWTAPSTAPDFYVISKNGIVIPEALTANTYEDTDLYPNTYKYKIASLSNVSGISEFVSADDVVVAGGVERNLVLVEVATGTNCGYCPGAAMGCADLLSNNKKVGIVKYQNYSSSDPYYSEVGKIHTAMYGISGFPTSIIDGSTVLSGGSATQSIYPMYLPHYERQISTPSLYTLDLSVENTEANKYEATIKVVKKSDYLKNPVKLFVALTESHVQYNWGNQTEVNERCIAMFPTENGTELTFSGEELTKKILFDLVPNTSLTLADYELVVFVQEDVTHAVNQTVKINLAEIAAVHDYENNQIAVYPNPATEFVTVKAAVNSDVQIIDMNGRVLKTQQMNADVQNIDIRGLNSGIYLMKITTGNLTYNRKLIVK